MVAKNICRTCFGLLILAACLCAPVAAQTGSITTEVILDRTGEPGTMIVDTIDPLTGDPIQMVVDTGAFINPCTNENVDVIGVTTISTLQTVDKFGTMKVNVSVVSKGSGLGWISMPGGPVFTGSAYAFSESQQFTFRLPSVGEEFASDFSEKFALRGAKSVDNWVARAHFRIRLNAAGEVQVSLVKTTADPVCKG